MPVGDLVSNGAYMVTASLAWSLKAWAALLLPEQGRWAAKYREDKRSLLRMEFSTFLRDDDSGALPGRAWCPTDCVPAAVMEPVAGSVPAVGRASARSPVVLRVEGSEAGVRMPRCGPYRLRGDERR